MPSGVVLIGGVGLSVLGWMQRKRREIYFGPLILCFIYPCKADRFFESE